MRKKIKIEDLRTCLSYDTEEKKFLSLNERCMIHLNQIKIINRSYPLELTPELSEKIKSKLTEIKRRRWRRPEYRFEKELGSIVRVKIK
ncbi:hypothetical protein O2K51_05180 [Apibacter raozihei]|uniref:hypothetical protein n=1 Tax=Apibacter TaxID=1778601 RepID=UPI000FE3D0ED|nr:MULTISPECIES: hypothetical protein [Apibacter]